MGRMGRDIWAKWVSSEKTPEYVSRRADARSAMALMHAPSVCKKEQKNINFSAYGRNGVATYGKTGRWDF